MGYIPSCEKPTQTPDHHRYGRDACSLGKMSRSGQGAGVLMFTAIFSREAKMAMILPLVASRTSSFSACFIGASGMQLRLLLNYRKTALVRAYHPDLSVGQLWEF